MRQEPKRIQFDEFALNPETLFEALAATKDTLLIERAGVVFRVEVDEQSKPDDIWAAYDAQLARAGLRKSVGALSDVDRAELLSDIHKARQQNSHGRPA